MALSELFDFIQEETPEIKSRKIYKTQLQDFFLDPSEEESTELGEVPHDPKERRSGSPSPPIWISIHVFYS